MKVAILKMFKKYLIATALLCGVTTAAHAALAVVETSTHLGSGISALPISNSGVYEFTLIEDAIPTSFLASTLEIFSGATVGSPLFALSGTPADSFFAAAGNYTAYVLGMAGKSSGSYSYTVSTVPEVETWVTLLIGMGLIVYQLRRKSKSLRGPAFSLA
jgi:hypothetical protein